MEGIEPQPFEPSLSGFSPPPGLGRARRMPCNPAINPHLLAFVGGLLGMVALFLALATNLIWPYLP